MVGIILGITQRCCPCGLLRRSLINLFTDIKAELLEDDAIPTTGTVFAGGFSEMPLAALGKCEQFVFCGIKEAAGSC
jgi:hypothetical protein